MNDDFLGWVVVVSSFFMVINYCVMLYVDHFILPDVEGELKNCSVVAYTKSFWGRTGNFGRSHRYAMVYLTLTSTRLLSKKGMADVDEVSRISLKSRLWIVLPMRFGFVSFISGMIALALLGKLW